MLNRLLYELFKAPNNGRQIATMPDGRRLLLIHSEVLGPATLRLRIARREEPEQLADFEDLGLVVGPGCQVPDGGPWGFGGCLAVISRTVHLAWTGPHGIHATNGQLAGGRFQWEKAQIVLDGDYWLGDLFPVGNRIALTYRQALDRQTEAVGLAWFDGRWRTREVHRGSPLFAPVADVDAGGRVHLAWGDVAEQVYHARAPGLGDKADVRLLGPGRQPVLLATPERVLIACESELGHIHAYDTDGTDWRRNVPLTVNNPWLTSDECHSPQLTRDRHGVPWLFFADNTRRSTFWARWLGDGWSDVVNGPRVSYRPPRFDANLLAVERLCVEKRLPGTARDVGLLLACQPPVRLIEYRREVVPDLEAGPGRKVLFLDLLEVARTQDVRFHVETAVKHPKNPLLELGPRGAFDEDRVFSHGTVLHDDGRYRMWYAGLREPRPGEPQPPWWDWGRTGYAESDDGITWKRVRVGLVDWDGSRDNNLVPGLRQLPVVMKDERDPDPRRRYKALHFWNSGEHLEMARSGKYGRRYDPRDEKFLVDLFTSPDGLRQEVHAGEAVFPDGQVKPLSAIPLGFFRDDTESDPGKRYKAYGFMSLNLRRRGAAYLYSADCLRWTAHPDLPVLDPAVRGTPPAAGGPTGQVHDTVCFPYEGYYLALYQDQHTPQRMALELAVSHDAARSSSTGKSGSTTAASWSTGVAGTRRRTASPAWPRSAATASRRYG
jgi:hypothetical protein